MFLLMQRPFVHPAVEDVTLESVLSRACQFNAPGNREKACERHLRAELLDGRARRFAEIHAVAPLPGAAGGGPDPIRAPRHGGRQFASLFRTREALSGRYRVNSEGQREGKKALKSADIDKSLFSRSTYIPIWRTTGGRLPGRKSNELRRWICRAGPLRKAEGLPEAFKAWPERSGASTARSPTSNASVTMSAQKAHIVHQSGEAEGRRGRRTFRGSSTIHAPTATR